MANRVRAATLPSVDVLAMEVEKEMLRAHPTVAHDAHIIVEHNKGTVAWQT